MNKRFRILFDASLMAEGDQASATRSGIFFTALNILKEMSKSPNLEIGIYCSNKRYSVKLQKTLEKYFPDNTFHNLYLEILSPLEKQKVELTYKYKSKKSFVTKLQLLLYSVMIKTLLQKTFKYEEILKDYDIYFSPVFKPPVEIQNVKSIRKFTLLHDLIPLIFPEYFKNLDPEKYWLFQLIKQINKTDYYFTNSVYTRNDFIRLIPSINEEHVTPVLLACSEDFKPRPVSVTKQSLKKYNLPTDKKYIFSLCTLEPRKNLIRAVKSFIEFIEKNKIDDMVFILGGGHWDGFIEQMEKEIPGFDKYRNIILKAGYIDDEDLAPLYSGAEWFVYTSEYEGFGLPPLEAMSCGCPVITSDTSSLPEVVGDAGIMIKFDSEDEHIKAYEKYYYDSALRNENRNKGIERAKEFTWEKCVNEMIKVWDKIIQK